LRSGFRAAAEIPIQDSMLVNRNYIAVAEQMQGVF
jgi:hypothetical protein